jgi:hypothetical protein
MVRVGHVKQFTDIGGMHILQLSNDEKTRHEFANRLVDMDARSIGPAIIGYVSYWPSTAPTTDDRRGCFEGYRASSDMARQILTRSGHCALEKLEGLAMPLRLT